MKQLQKWFDLIAGIAYDEQEKLARARAIFEQQAFDTEDLHLPACWRRAARIAQVNE